MDGGIPPLSTKQVLCLGFRKPAERRPMNDFLMEYIAASSEVASTRAAALFLIVRLGLLSPHDKLAGRKNRATSSRL
jgi:hypothetical protein